MMSPLHLLFLLLVTCYMPPCICVGPHHRAHNYIPVSHSQSAHHLSHEQQQRIVDATLAQIQQDESFQSNSDLIIQTIVNGTYKGLTWDRLAAFTDTIGNRVCGSPELEAAVDYMVAALKNDGLDNVHAERTALPYWYRGKESATLIQPRSASIAMLGLGGSVGTQSYGANGLTAEVLVVSDWDELTRRAGEAAGKIVLFNQQCDWELLPIVCYGLTVGYREGAASAVAAVGGVAALIRSVAAFSINSPHTGMMVYNTSLPKIPTAAITIEDADMLQRMQARGQNIVLNLQMQAKMVSDAALGHNVIAEWTGTTLANETVLVSGHLDSWDVGVGAMDDGGGALISWTVLSVLRSLNLRAKRTLRLVMWSCEEFGGIGANQYFQAHKNEVDSMSIVMESDMGVFLPQGLQFTGGSAATQIVTSIGQLLSSINATQVVGGGDGTDIAPWMAAGVPGASLLNENQRYFWFHHSHGDRMNVLTPDEVDLSAAVWAVHAFSIANLDTLLPRTP